MNKEISYEELAKKVGNMVLCNNVTNTDEYWYDHIINGMEQPEEWNEEQDGEFDSMQVLESVYQTYIITPYGASELVNHTKELVGYNPILDVFIWHITHYGTGWSHVHTQYNEDADHVYDLSDLIKHID